MRRSTLSDASPRRAEKPFDQRLSLNQQETQLFLGDSTEFNKIKSMIKKNGSACERPNSIRILAPASKLASFEKKWKPIGDQFNINVSLKKKEESFNSAQFRFIGDINVAKKVVDAMNLKGLDVGIVKLTAEETVFCNNQVRVYITKPNLSK